jgi:adenylate cyclase
MSPESTALGGPTLNRARIVSANAETHVDRYNRCLLETNYFDLMRLNVEFERLRTPRPARQPVTVNIYIQTKLEYTTTLSDRLELGRQRVDEVGPFTRVDDRVIIAKLEQSDISRQHVLLALTDDGVRITNCSKVNPLFVGTDDRIQPDSFRDVQVPALLVLGDKVVQLEPVQQPADDLGSFIHRTTAPGQQRGGESAIQDFISLKRSPEETEFVLRGLYSVNQAFQSATDSTEFLTRATQALIDVVHLETAAALYFVNDEWKIQSLHAREGATDEFIEEWEPSRTILDSVRNECKTFWRINDITNADSLIDVRALVAAPILNAEGEVIGALYGDRRRDRLGRVDVQISEVEAALVELLSSGVAAGLARLEQERAATKARILFEQFFTPELSQQLESEPNLLLGKDTEVTLLYCTIRGFSEVSESLGARLTLDWIDDVLSTIAGCISDQQGTLVDTLGDEVIGMWGAPIERDDHAEYACRTAIDMYDQLNAINNRWLDALDKPIDLGIGIHTGIARVGNIGSNKKFKYGPLGRVVHDCRRTLKFTDTLATKILITDATAAKLTDEFSLRRLSRMEDEFGDTLGLNELATDVKGDWMQQKRRYEASLEAFERDDFPTATRLIAKILSEHPNDRPSLQLLKQITDKLID